MTPEQIEKWTRQASAIGDANELSGDAIAEFARLVAQDTWERAAQCGERWIHKHRTDALETQDEGCDFVDGAQGVINDIRAAAAREAK